MEHSTQKQAMAQLMSRRVGPPSPRNEPWRPEMPPLGEQPGRTAVASNHSGYSAEFVEGWNAHAAYVQNNLPEPVDNEVEEKLEDKG
jgi:hypothetical protein